MAGSLKVKLKVGERGVSEQDGTEKVVADLRAPVVHHSPPVNIEDTQNVHTAQPSNNLIWSSKDEKIGATVLEATEGVAGTCTDGQTTGEDGLMDGTITSEPQKLKKQIKLKLNI
jgi:hypothetical protein